VIIRGRFYTNTWIDNQQQTRTSLEIEADSLGHDLAYGWSHFLRGVRQPSRDNGGGDGDGGELARQETSDTAEAFETSEAADAFDTPGGDGGLGDLEAGLAASEAGLPDSLERLAEPEAVPF
jgi:single-strand DNA-binding protein